MTATRTVLLTLALSAFVGASRITSLSSYALIAKQNPTEEEFPVDNGEWETDIPGSVTEWDPRCPSVGSGAICMDCNKISVCLRGKVLPARDCPRDAPYCVNSDGFGGHCSAKPDEDREDCRSDFQCSSEGYFPGELGQVDDELSYLMGILFHRSKQLPLLLLVRLGSESFQIRLHAWVRVRHGQQKLQETDLLARV